MIVLVDGTFTKSKLPNVSTGISFDKSTKTIQKAFLVPSIVDTVIVSIPSSIPEIIPNESIEAMDELHDFHITFLSAASIGRTVAFKVSLIPTTITIFSLFKEIPVETILGGTT